MGSGRTTRRPVAINDQGGHGDMTRLTSKLDLLIEAASRIAESAAAMRRSLGSIALWLEAHLKLQRDGLLHDAIRRLTDQNHATAILALLFFSLKSYSSGRLFSSCVPQSPWWTKPAARGLLPWLSQLSCFSKAAGSFVLGWGLLATLLVWHVRSILCTEGTAADAEGLSLSQVAHAVRSSPATTEAGAAVAGTSCRQTMSGASRLGSGQLNPQSRSVSDVTGTSAPSVMLAGGTGGLEDRARSTSIASPAVVVFKAAAAACLLGRTPAVIVLCIWLMQGSVLVWLLGQLVWSLALSVSVGGAGHRVGRWAAEDAVPALASLMGVGFGDTFCGLLHWCANAALPVVAGAAPFSLVGFPGAALAAVAVATIWGAWHSLAWQGVL